jgi:uncharacterized C2H2 Zn-finger protein
MWTPDKHPHEDEFEDYAFGRLSLDDANDFEEHLLRCERCQQTLAQTDDYIRHMKAATAVYVAERSRIRPYAIRLLDHGLRRSIAAAAVLLLAFLTALLSSRTPSGRAPSGDPQTILLEAYRAGGVSALTRCPAGRPLNLKIDLTEAQPAVGYRVEVVDATGQRVWFGGTPARLTKGLAPGTYWVRLSTDTGEPLREFGLIAVR